MRTIARIQYGSKLYVTQIPTSDNDFFEVYIPSPKIFRSSAGSFK